MSPFRELDEDGGEWGPVVRMRADWDNERETYHQVGRVRRAFGLSVVLLLLFHSAALVGLVRELPVAPVEDGIVALAETWHGQMEKNGFTDPGIGVRDWVSELRALNWAEIGVWLGNEGARKGVTGPSGQA